MMIQAKEIIESGALGRITATSLAGSNSMFIGISAKYEYMNDPNSGKQQNGIKCRGPRSEQLVIEE